MAKNKKALKRKPFLYYWKKRPSNIWAASKRESQYWFNLGRAEEYKHMSQPIVVRNNFEKPGCE